MQKIVVLISGNGSNLQAIMDTCDHKVDGAEVVAVFSNNADAYGLERARLAGIDSRFVDPSEASSREVFDQILMRQIDQYQPDLIVLAGYMRILTDEFVQHFLGRMINIHPSLLPKYPGLNTHQRAIDAGETEHGTSVHFVTPELDGGPVILQAKVPIFTDDTAQSLAERVQAQEHNIYPLTVQWLISGRLNMQGNAAVLDGKVLASSGYASDS